MDEQHRVIRQSNLREEASTKARIAAVVSEGALVHVIGEDGDWRREQFNGWMHKDLLQSVDPPQLK